jgi:hypothetical protein
MTRVSHDFEIGKVNCRGLNGTRLGPRILSKLTVIFTSSLTVAWPIVPNVYCRTGRLLDMVISLTPTWPIVPNVYCRTGPLNFACSLIRIPSSSTQRVL